MWRKVDGEWRIANDIWNSDLPAAAAPGTTLGIIHEVEDVARWLAAWQGGHSPPGLLVQHGAPSVRVFQSPDAPNLTGLPIDVADMEAFQAFMACAEAEAAKADDGVKDATFRVVKEVNSLSEGGWPNQVAFCRLTRDRHWSCL